MTIINHPLRSDTDGIDHINVHHKGKTDYGKALAPTARLPIVLPDGAFDSISGYYYWLLSSHPKRDELRTWAGPESIELGRFYTIPGFYGNSMVQDGPEHRAAIRTAIQSRYYKYYNGYVQSRRILLCGHTLQSYNPADFFPTLYCVKEWFLDMLGEYKC